MRGLLVGIIILISCLDLSRAGPLLCADTLRTEASTAFFRPMPGGRFMSFRSSARHFWNWTHQYATDYFSNKELKLTGVITGDPHIENFGAIRTEKGVRFGLIDLDDAGRGPFVLDAAKLLLSFKAQGVRISSETLAQHYLDGLTGKKYEKPEFMKIRDDDFNFEKALFKYGDKASRRHKFDQEETQLQPYQRNPSTDLVIRKALNHLRKVFPDAELVDVGQKTKQTGGSQGLKRIWILLNVKGDLAVYELKEMAPPATELINDQLETKARLNEVVDIYWKERSEHFAVIQSGQSEFWLRPRLKKSFDPTELSNQEMSAYVRYLAFYLGHKHGSQLDQSQRDHVETQQERLRESMVSMVTDYFNQVLRRFSSEL